MPSRKSTGANGDGCPTVSLVITIRNEAANLPDLLASIEQQTLAPDEVIIVDGGSIDNSLAILDSWLDRLPIRVLVHENANISQGRNIGIAHTRGEIIAVTDAGVRLDREWLEQLVNRLTRPDDPVDVASGFFLPDSQTDFETALAATTLPDIHEIDAETFLPSSRSVAFRKSWFDAGVRYPEWLDYCEDLVFDLRLKQAGARFAFQPRALVHFRPRSDARAFWRQYFHYAQGDGKAGLFLKRHLSRYITYLLIVPSFFVVRSPKWRILVLLGAAGYMRRPVLRLWNRTNGDPGQTLRLGIVAAGLRWLGDIAKMAGYPVGLLWRARRYGLRKGWKTIPEPRSRQDSG